MSLPPELPSRRMALFGGSFDPVHHGHVAIARAAAEQAGLDQVIFIPAAQSPLKTGGPQASGALRLAMLEAALAEEPRAVVSSWELDRTEQGPSYSWITAAHFTGQGRPGDEWFWLMGADQWRQLERWRNWRRLAGMVTFLVFARDGERPQPKEGIFPFFLSGEFRGSSTGVRAAVAAGGAWDSLVPAGTADIIRRHGLYRNGATAEQETCRGSGGECR